MAPHMLVVLCAAALAAPALAQPFARLDIGNQLVRDFTSYYVLPITADEAAAAGWSVYNSTCGMLGIAWTVDPAGPIKSKPMTLYFTPAGQAAGVGIRIFGEVKANLISQGFFKPTPNSNEFDIAVTFRGADTICSSAPSSFVLGDRLVVNADSIAVELPLTSAEADKAAWTRGSCFFGMGYHYFRDLLSGPQMSWEAANLLPIVTMYNNGTINAFFFASSTVQQGLTSTNWWEKIPLPNFLMCKNWCDSSCTFHDTYFWSTLHIYMNNYKQVFCPNDCTIACCDP